MPALPPPPNTPRPGTLVPVLPPGAAALPLHGLAASRALESAGAACLPAHTLMQRAGLAVARLALAVAPHAQRIWVACGPGNNGGDGLHAARHLALAGKHVALTWLGQAGRLSEDTRDALAQAQAAGLNVSDGWPAKPPGPQDLAIDALLGLGVTRAPEGRLAEAVSRLNSGDAPVLAVDLPSGLDADTGWLDHPERASRCVRASHTLSLLSLKPSLFTAHGRDHAGRVWLCPLDVDPGLVPADAWLAGQHEGTGTQPQRRHAQHKGSFGNVAVIGGAAGMSGAAVLAGQAALERGAGRVYVHLLGSSGSAPAVWPAHAELMFRPLPAAAAFAGGDFTVVCGCGGGSAIADVLADVIEHAARLLLDADALNALAGATPHAQGLRDALARRAARGAPTVLTPHPLEAARMLGTDTEAVQRNRLAAAQQLAASTGAVVVLKGSGTVIASASPQALWLNPAGNARLGTAGTGDVLAGWIAALWAQGLSPLGAAVAAAYQHGQAADLWPASKPLTAGHLAAGG